MASSISNHHSPFQVQFFHLQARPHKRSRLRFAASKTRYQRQRFLNVFYHFRDFERLQPQIFHQKCGSCKLLLFKRDPRTSRGRMLKFASSTRALLESADTGSNDAHDVDTRTHLERKGKVAFEKAVDRLNSFVGAISPVLVKIKRDITPNVAFGISIGLALVVVILQKFVFAKPIQRQHGSVADLVKRGQLRSDRRGISKPFKYEDPFNNPLVKMHKSDSTAEICGKVYRLAPVTLTDEQKSSHQKRRSRAYNWKRPTVFLKEGDEMPSDVDPDTVRWIPSNHPFAAAASDIDENLAQTNVYQKDGVPFRIRVEHEALQRKMEALQNEKKLSKVALTPNSLRSIEKSSESPLQESNFDEHQELSQNDLRYPDKATSLREPEEP